MVTSVGVGDGNGIGVGVGVGVGDDAVLCWDLLRLAPGIGGTARARASCPSRCLRDLN